MSTAKALRLEYPEAYSSWCCMKSRCYNPKTDRYPSYGGRGIRVCARWLNSFSRFLADMGPRPEDHTLERVDNDGPYCKDNCRWATNVEQGNNKSTNVTLTYQGRTMTKAEWARELGVTRYFLQNRLNRGWSVEAALTTPARNYKKGIA